MSNPSWDNEAWEQIGDYERFWTPFDNAFHFQPGVDPSTWPAIHEPSESVTFDLSPVFNGDDQEFAAGERALNSLVLTAMTEVFAEDAKLVALDWQHPSYWFWPHRLAAASEPWRIQPFPNGDYYIFLSEDLTQGTFGHPWEQILCVLGPKLVTVLSPLPADWLPV